MSFWYDKQIHRAIFDLLIQKRILWHPDNYHILQQDPTNSAHPSAKRIHLKLCNDCQAGCNQVFESTIQNLKKNFRQNVNKTSTFFRKFPLWARISIKVIRIFGVFSTQRSWTYTVKNTKNPHYCTWEYVPKTFRFLAWILPEWAML